MVPRNAERSVRVWGVVSTFFRAQNLSRSKIRHELNAKIVVVGQFSCVRGLKVSHFLRLFKGHLAHTGEIVFGATALSRRVH